MSEKGVTRLSWKSVGEEYHYTHRPRPGILSCYACHGGCCGEAGGVTKAVAFDHRQVPLWGCKW